MNLEILKQSGTIILEAISGSHAYGLNTPTSDKDIRGVFITPKSDWLSLFEPINEVGDDTNDIKFYELRKFIKLAGDNNPNVIELLFQPDDTIITKSPAMQYLYDNRSAFISKLCHKSFVGYAYAQIGRAKGKNKLVHNPKPKERPTKQDFCFVVPINNPNRNFNCVSPSSMPMRPIKLSESGVDLTKCHAAAMERLPNTFRLYDYSDCPLSVRGVFRNEMLVSESIPMDDENQRFVGLLIYNENEYNRELVEWKQYWEWVENRNEDRWQKQETGELSYDTKNIMHCFRLLYSGINIMEQGEPILRFTGETRDFLMRIRGGEFEYDYLMAEADKLMDKLRSSVDSSKLPEKPDWKELNYLYRNVYAHFAANT